MAFPSPVGGQALPSDFAPSVFFAVLYGLLFPLMCYRMFARSSRTTLLIGSFCFAIERTVFFGLRASQARKPEVENSNGLATYFQVTLGMGFIGIANDLVGLVRCLLVNPTYGSDTYAQSPGAESTHLNDNVDAEASNDTPGLSRTGDFPGKLPNGTPDHEKTRFWSRRFSDLTNLAFLAAFIPGILANSRYADTFNNQKQADRTMNLRYASTAVALVLTFALGISAVWARRKLVRVSQNGATMILALTCFLTVVAIYRLSVMFNRTDSLFSTEPAALNSRGSKTLFYIFHVLPEWLATAVLFGYNIRRTFSTGPFGDWRNADETEKERVKREKEEAKHRERLAQKKAKKETPQPLTG